jgi:hypothetical protein
LLAEHLQRTVSIIVTSPRLATEQAFVHERSKAALETDDGDASETQRGAA